MLQCVPGKPFVIMTLRGRNESLPSVMLYSHTDVVPAPFSEECWKFAPFEAVKDVDGKIYGRGTQDMKSIGIQYVEALRRLLGRGQQKFLRTVHIVWGPGHFFFSALTLLTTALFFFNKLFLEEEVGGADGMEKFADDPKFAKLNVGFVLDEGLPTENDTFKVYFADKCPWWVVVCCRGQAGHGSQFLENTAGEKLQRVINSFMGFREEQKKLLESNKCLKACDVVTVNLTKIELAEVMRRNSRAVFRQM
ncbi:unnamed protein product [Gongylonema pulchrum]|uniref:N-acyl-L-amino-acid amidohydrolase n=1 Tax=Gongylonema pulchrum TaxID=637853 RepID=A0A183CZF1_9BILA|nr:unnamed protein product [Gongylonema pulchrum]